MIIFTIICLEFHDAHEVLPQLTRFLPHLFRVLQRVPGYPSYPAPSHVILEDEEDEDEEDDEMDSDDEVSGEGPDIIRLPDPPGACLGTR